MRHEVRSIPPAPRSVKLRPLLAHRWPLLFSGCALVVLGSLIAWAMFLQSGARLGYAPRLASEPTRDVQGTVTRVGLTRHFDGRDWQQVNYEFDWLLGDKALPMAEVSFAPSGRYQVGDTAPVRVLEATPNISCIEGGVPHMSRQWLYARFWLTYAVVPGGLILLGWITGIFQLRRVLVHGDVSVGHVRSVARVRWILPEMLVVRYEFRDHHATTRRNRHWVRARGALGTRLMQPPAHGANDALPVLHNRRMPHWNRILLPQDFLRSAPVEPPVMPE